MNNAESSTAASGLTWFKSSYSGAEGGQCVEVSARTTAVHVRDSKDTSLPHFSVSRDAWSGFVELASAEPRV
ncbi:DUF397 domain-containing protein [Streptomyces acidiscabies]|uniref:DUF397 domain-containing protein n=1 Tax=Streptomyces acidiscabies TaxID=42234 RepID=A0AAP6BFQ8_9ACTN|nr:DUF397 domain-containing protein [Streptomyces acidiscabies]MBP5937356.1 DUF397 domain-containing protein [Streptomyces sp. LBUM 1476]MBZ3914576.1 DUF397 domain-containing protein [Streptomyces acidiscabies]MDX2963912.1 DUF397 domain-containing protein [Streptomyces acidiscabies]MDX3017264.1 DUF397 domain-containing protein [Streptomyces acidiscabies]MDX3789215.1 DUF397 domain-containing protein [Streptomyces acidiscabies]